VGLTPLSLHEAWDGAGRRDLGERLRSLAELGMDRLAILFDDMPGDFPDLAQTQGDILKFVADHDVAPRLMMCPTYYSESAILDRLFGARPAILDRLFGARPEGYLHDLGAALDPHVEVCWTGNEICSTSYESEHLRIVSEQLGRKPLIWDNYPVNDGPRMCRFLHLRAPDRPAQVLEEVSGVMVNPMNQYQLSRVPMIAMSRSLRGESSSEDPTAQAMKLALPANLAQALCGDWPRFQDEGLDGLEETEKREFVERYSDFDHPAASELVDWLEGRTIVSADILTDV
jgi:hypothetical protein